MATPDVLTQQLQDTVNQAFEAGRQAGTQTQLTDDGYRRHVAAGMVADLLGVIATQWLKMDSEAAQIVADAAGKLSTLASQPHPLAPPIVPAPTPPPPAIPLA